MRAISDCVRCLLMAVLALAALAAQEAPPAQPAWANGSGQDQAGVWADLTVGDATQRLRWIRPGSFLMGSPAGEAERDADEVAHRVTLTRGFWLGDSEVTRLFWHAVMGGAPVAEAPSPATASWDEDQVFLARLDQLKPGLEAALPSEAQWEYACRAGTTGSTHAPLDGIAWYLITAADQYGNCTLHPVKQKAANAWGLHDMLGNSWEATRDWYGPYPTGALSDPTGPATGNRHVVRGGSSRNAAGACRAAWRWAEFPPAKGVGLRLMVPGIETTGK